MQLFAAPANPVRIVQSCRTQENLDFCAETASSLSAYRVCAASKLPRQDDEAKASRSAIGSAEGQERTFGLASTTSSASFLFPRMYRLGEKCRQERPHDTTRGGPHLVASIFKVKGSRSWCATDDELGEQGSPSSQTGD